MRLGDDAVTELFNLRSGVPGYASDRQGLDMSHDRTEHKDGDSLDEPSLAQAAGALRLVAG